MSGIHFGELEQVFTVVTAACRVIRSRRRQAEVVFATFCRSVSPLSTPAFLTRGRSKWDGFAVGSTMIGAVQAHLDLQVTLRSAVVGARSRACRRTKV